MHEVAAGIGGSHVNAIQSGRLRYYDAGFYAVEGQGQVNTRVDLVERAAFVLN